MTEKETKEQKVKKERSTAYPYIALEQALEYSAKLVDAYRKNPFSRQNAVEGIGHKKITGDTAQKIAALGHYGLLERSGNSAYRNTELAQRICYFTTDEQKMNDIAVAAQQPKLFRKLIADHTGQSLPARLNNILINPHGINPNVADKVANNFKKTLEFAGLLTNGVVGALTEEDAGDDTSLEADITPASLGGSRFSPMVPNPRPASSTSSPATGMQNLMLPSGIIISYSADLAYQFAIGKFAAQITALDEVVATAKIKPQDAPGTNTTSPIE